MAGEQRGWIQQKVFFKTFLNTQKPTKIMHFYQKNVHFTILIYRVFTLIYQKCLQSCLVRSPLDGVIISVVGRLVESF
jgi:hypothetical protein